MAEPLDAGALLTWIRERHRQALVARVDVDEHEGKPRITIHSARPGILIGKRAATVEALKRELEQRHGAPDLLLHIVEIRRMELEPLLVADHVAMNIARWVNVARTLERTPKMSLRCGAKGVRVRVSGCCGDHDVSEGELCEGAADARVDEQMGPKLDENDVVVDVGGGAFVVEVWIRR